MVDLRDVIQGINSFPNIAHISHIYFEEPGIEIAGYGFDLLNDRGNSFLSSSAEDEEMGVCSAKLDGKFAGYRVAGHMLSRPKIVRRLY